MALQYPLRRRSEALRTERLEEIRVQIANGTLLIRQMTTEEHEAAVLTARAVRSRANARRKLRRQIAAIKS